MPDINAEYRKRFMRQQLAFATRYKDLFDKIADDFSRMASDPNIKFTRAFRFPDYIRGRIDDMMAEFHGDMLGLVKTDVEKFWNLSNSKNDEIVKQYLNTIAGIKAAQKATYMIPNIPALKSFIARSHGSGTLSSEVWKVTKQYRAELEIQLGIGIANGDSAQVISRRVRQYLNNPDALFRRVRDSKGRLVASKTMKELHPGRGVYRSSYKNAMRLTRTETNQAYHLADLLRWEQMDMVKGYEVKLSAAHRIFDICDEVQGIYPKDFVWVGWHPSCLCTAVPVLMAQEDFMEYLRTGERDMNNMVTMYPQNFQKHVRDNFDRYSNYKSKPYWIRDNTEVVKNIAKK
jgi:hypothetical protein